MNNDNEVFDFNINRKDIKITQPEEKFNKLFKILEEKKCLIELFKDINIDNEKIGKTIFSYASDFFIKKGADKTLYLMGIVLQYEVYSIEDLLVFKTILEVLSDKELELVNERFKYSVVKKLEKAYRKQEIFEI